MPVVDGLPSIEPSSGVTVHVQTSPSIVILGSIRYRTAWVTLLILRPCIGVVYRVIIWIYT